MNSNLKKIAAAIAVAGLAVLGTGASASAHQAPPRAQHSTLWCC